MSAVLNAARPITRSASRVRFGRSNNPKRRFEQWAKKGFTNITVLAVGNANSICRAETEIIRRNGHRYKQENRTDKSLGRIVGDRHYLYVVYTPKAGSRFGR